MGGVRGASLGPYASIYTRAFRSSEREPNERGAGKSVPRCVSKEDYMAEALALYTVDEAYADYLVPHTPQLFRSARAAQAHSRKYVGVVLAVGGHDYFAPLSSVKDKHRRMKNDLDFVKVKDMAVVNLNNMFPVPVSCCQRVDFAAERDRKYRALLQAEYRAMKPLQDRIHKNARTLYSYKLKYGDSTRLAKRCNDFAALERLCDAYGK